MTSRIETKYLISYREFLLFKDHLVRYFKQDPYSINGSYDVSSLYFDSFDFKAFYEKEEGEFYKEKWRLRMYKRDVKTLRLEKKIKEGRVSLKKYYDFSPNNQQIELLTRIPKLFVSYERQAFFDDKTRITIDSNLSYAKVFHWSDILTLNQSFTQENLFVLEIKQMVGDQTEYLETLIHQLHLKSTAFSKYSHGVKLIYGL